MGQRLTEELLDVWATPTSDAARVSLESLDVWAQPTQEKARVSHESLDVWSQPTQEKARLSGEWLDVWVRSSVGQRPQVKATVSQSVIWVKFSAVSTDYASTAAALAATRLSAIVLPPPFVYVGDPMKSTDILYVYALAYDNNGNESALVRLVINGPPTDVITSDPAAVVTTVTVSIPFATISVGSTFLATATPRDKNGTIVVGRTTTWSSLDTGVATVDASSGIVTGVAAGSTVIRASVDGITGDAVLAVTVAVTGGTVTTVTVSLQDPNLATGATEQATATAKDANGTTITGRTVAWSSLSAGVATVNASTGVVTGVSGGTATIRATIDGVHGDATVTVSAATGVTSTVTVSLQDPNLTTGYTTIATATARDANGNSVSGRTVAWSSLNTGVATAVTGSIALTPGATGVVTGIAAGSTTIRATIDGVHGDAAVTVADAIIVSGPPTDHPNEPTGMTQLSPLLDGNTVPQATWTPVGWIGIGVTQQTDTVPGIGPTNVLQAFFPPGFAGGSAPALAYTQYSATRQDWPQQVRTLYQSYWYRLSPSFPANLVGNKMIYSQINFSNSIYSDLFCTADEGTTYTAPIHPALAIQNTLQSGLPVVGTPSSTNTFETSKNYVNWGVQIARGPWFFVETVYVGNTAGNPDGFIRLWINGVLVIYVPNIQWDRSGAASFWNVTFWDPVYGGGGQVASDAVNPFHRLKDFYVSGKP